MNAKLKLPKSKKSQVNLDNAATMLKNVTGNPKYVKSDPILNANIPPKVTALTTIRAARVAAKALEKSLAVQEKDANDALSAELQASATQLESEDTSEASLTSMGIPIASTNKNAADMPKPTNLKIKVLPDKTTARFTFKAIRNSRFYKVEKCTGDPNVPANWTLYDEPAEATTDVTDVPYGTVLFLRVTAVGVKGPGPTSESVNKKIPA